MPFNKEQNQNASEKKFNPKSPKNTFLGMYIYIKYINI